jgi:hypothetical protein
MMVQRLLHARFNADRDHPDHLVLVEQLMVLRCGDDGVELDLSLPGWCRLWR